MDIVRINERDNVGVDIESGHKYALRSIKIGDDVIKYGYPIGIATCDIEEGDHVHSHNIKSKLGDILSYVYKPDITKIHEEKPVEIEAFVRENGDIGIRNDIWIIPTVGCANAVAEQIARRTGAISFTHPYGCSQLGDDMTTTQLVLSGLIKHPNAGGVLVLGLGCENNNLSRMKNFLGDIDTERIRFLNLQDCEDEITEGVKIIEELQAIANTDKRENVSISRLRVGLKCGGSDGYSGITANAVVGLLTDKIASMGATAVMTEVPEMFGAEEIIFNRCINEEIFNKSVALINDFKQYYKNHGMPISENPSPGNKDGGITTLEEKSLGCVQKGGSAPITDVLTYGDTATKSGLNLLNGPGNDIVSLTNLAAAGCHMVLFTTGRGTPLGGAVPTVKISSNNSIAIKKPHWIDFNAFGDDKVRICDDLFNLVTEVANGTQTNNETHGYREIAIFKDGVTL